MLFSTLFCLKGFDTAWRFVAINITMLILTLLSSAIFYQNGFSLVVAFGFATIAACANYRRLKAIKGFKPSMVVSPLLLIFIALIPLLGISFWFGGVFFLLFVVFVALIGVKPSKINVHGFVQGYYGPKLAEQEKVQNRQQRQDPFISANDQSNEPQASLLDGNTQAAKPLDTDFSAEPLFETSSAQQSQFESEPYSNNYSAFQTPSFTKQKQKVGLWCRDHKRLLLTIITMVIAVVILTVIGYVASQLGSKSATNNGQNVIEKEVQPVAIKRISVKVPDGFWVVKEADILIIRWLGDEGQAHNLWKLATAKGESACQQMTFNNQNVYRPLTVDLMSDSGIEARFSPLDNRAIVTDIAMRGSFTLCGYKFNLKGSQAALMSLPEFAKEL
ncbi:hypothetical protein ACFOD0_09355 [Shewanella intestini]|uniref:DUF805 domain-containing protein n=1 Tax=Shewanella intestini TaxID=2017544 RepID=A0ABS5I254_9GAMM|nr:MULTISPECIES: hypothetical protein [Shewanella]MBR9728113.1 hypothetical protein [Shewanella intestini]MRG36584.1 hypothetical protein [Shewanella sp. XMDDZSB0408]